MKKEEFEQTILELWVRSRIPLTQANLQYASGQSRRKVRKWLDALVADGVLDADVDDDQLVWTVPGSRRPARGPQSFEEYERLQALRADVATEAGRKQEAKQRMLDEARRRKRAELEKRQRERAGSDAGLEDVSTAMATRGASELARRAKNELTRKPGENEKSLLVSGGLSMLLGPLGWLYAGSFRESIPAAALWLLGGAILMKLPMLLLMPVMLVALPLSGIAGVVYAWQYNRSGERQRLWDKNEDEDE